MANWYSTYFEIEDKEIVKLIENKSIDFYYDEANGCGHCSLRWDFAALDVDTIENIAKSNNSSFLIRSSDGLTNTQQTWIYENGEEKLFESKQVEFVMEYVEE